MAEKKLINPEKNELQISGFHNTSYFIFMAKIYLKKFEEIELHALGAAISTSVQTADALQKSKLVEILKVSTFSMNPEKKETETEKEQQDRKKIKMVIKIKRTPEFMEKTANIK